jgi:hypothetical protein
MADSWPPPATHAVRVEEGDRTVNCAALELRIPCTAGRVVGNIIVCIYEYACRRKPRHAGGQRRSGALLIRPVAVDFHPKQSVSVLQIGTNLPPGNRPRKRLRAVNAVGDTSASVATICANIDAGPIVKIRRHFDAAGQSYLPGTHRDKNNASNTDAHGKPSASSLPSTTDFCHLDAADLAHRFRVCQSDSQVFGIDSHWVRDL